VQTSSTSSSDSTWRSTLVAGALLAAALVGLDLAWGRAATSLESRVIVGEAVGVFNLARISEPEITILGSSRAYLNFSPRHLGDRVANLGVNGQGVAIARVLWSLSPQKGGIVVIDPMFFDEEISRLSGAQHLRGANPVVDEVLAPSGWREHIKFASNFYSHAHAVLPAFANLGKKQDWRNRRGSLPSAARELVQAPGGPLLPGDWWWTQLDRLVAEVRARGATPVIVISPCANRRYDLFFDEVVRRHSPTIKIIDDRNALPLASAHFADLMHLNASAAEAWSSGLRPRLPLSQQP
jgi:hypothetical protein